MPDHRSSRSAIVFYVLGGLVIAAGCGAFVYTLFTSIAHTIDSLVQVNVPGQKELTFKPNAWYTIFLEEGSSPDGKIYAKQPELKDLTCHVTSRTTGNKLGLRHPSGSSSYSINSRSGHSVLEFQTQESGTYEFSCGYPEGTQGPQVILAVGPDITPDVFKLVWTALAEMFGGCFLGALIIVIGVLRNRRPQGTIPQGVLPPPR